MPYGIELGERYIRQTIEAIEKINLSDADRRKIFEENAKVLLHLD